jgi:hypothetical protein
MNLSAKDTVFIRDSTVIIERLFENLSYTNNFKLVFLEYFRNQEAARHYWTILIYDKKMNLLDSVVQPAYVFHAASVKLDDARSYITGVNKNKQVCDNYFGDFVVADFNFDSKNDFAIINDIGGNGGAFYSFYIQQESKKFIFDRFLTDSMVYFPSDINSKGRILKTYVHAGVCWVGEHKYRLDATTKRWSEISHKEIDVCKGKD